MTYYLYHIPGKKIGITKDLKKRVEDQQGYNEGEYNVILETNDINVASEAEISLQKAFGYRVDETPYNKLKFNKKENDMNINITEATTTFPCPVNKLKGQLHDAIGMSWETEHGDCKITNASIKWIMANIQTSRYNSERSYVYNKAFSRYFDNNNAFIAQDSPTRTGGLSPTGPSSMDQYRGEQKPEVENKVDSTDDEDCGCGGGDVSGILNKDPEDWNIFDHIRDWANTRGIYQEGNPAMQVLKLHEEAGEISRAYLKQDLDEMKDGIGDVVVVLTNLAHQLGTTIEDCIELAFDEIKNRKGKMANGTYVKE